MKRLIIVEEEKRRILGLYNRFLINEQDTPDYSKMTFEELKDEYKKIQNIDTEYETTKQKLKKDSKVFLTFILGEFGKVKGSIDDMIKSIQNNKRNDYTEKFPYSSSEYPPISNELKKFLEDNNAMIFNEIYEKVKKIAEQLYKIYSELPKTKTEENIVTNFDRKYDYKKDGDKYYYRLKSKPENWIEATNESAKSAIATLVFKEKSGCVYPEGELCKDWDLENWSDNPEFNSEKVNTKTNIGFCSKHYCTVKYIQDSINDLIENSEYENSIGHKKLKGYPKLTVDGKFGQNTQNYIYALLGKVSTTPIEFFEQFKEA